MGNTCLGNIQYSWGSQITILTPKCCPLQCNYVAMQRCRVPVPEHRLFKTQTQMHWIQKNTREKKKNLNSPDLQAYLYFKTVKYNWHNGKHYMNLQYFFFQDNWHFTGSSSNQWGYYLLERNTWDWSIYTNPRRCVFFFYLHILYDVPSNIWIPLCSTSYIDWTGLHAVSPLILSARTYRTHSLAVWHEQNGQWLTGQTLQPFTLCVRCRITE